MALPRPRAWWWLVPILAFVAFTQYLPHVPSATEPSFPYAALAYRAWDAAHGRDDPYPLHVDEHDHIAQMAQVDRLGHAHTPDPLSGADPEGSLFTVGGLRKERGFDVAIVQLHHLTGLSLPALARWLPATWSAFLGLGVWLALRGAPGALASVALLAALQTSARFLGTGLLVPSAFALPWLLAVLVASTRGAGPPRLAALALLITGAFFLHIVIGTLALLVGLICALLGDASWRNRLALAAATLLPLVWIVPIAAADIEAALLSEHTLPFETAIFSALGGILVALAAAGAFAAWYKATGRLEASTRPHRILFVLALLIMASLAISLRNEHHNDATYSRLIPTLFLCVAGLGGLGAAAAGRGLTKGLSGRSWGKGAAPAITALLVTAALAAPLQAQLTEPMYRVFDDREWRAGQAFAALPGAANTTFLSDSWNAPVYNALTGAKPWTYLKPGAEPVNGRDLQAYLTGSADAPWFRARGITHVVGLPAPQAPHTTLAPGLYALQSNHEPVQAD